MAERQLKPLDQGTVNSGQCGERLPRNERGLTSEGTRELHFDAQTLQIDLEFKISST